MKGKKPPMEMGSFCALTARRSVAFVRGLFFTAQPNMLAYLRATSFLEKNTTILF